MEGFTTKKQQFATVWKMHTAGDAQWYPAQVPGTVYTDLLRNGQIDGYEALTSRALGTYLGSSARPIFTVFKNMEEVPNALEVKASYPSALTIFNAASIISAFVNLAFGDRKSVV